MAKPPETAYSPLMHLDMKTAEDRLAERLEAMAIGDARDIAWATVWLEA